MNKNANSRIVIIGAGPVGLACALALSSLPRSSLQHAEIVLVDRQALVAPLGQPQTPLLGRSLEHFDNRVYAIAPSSKALLERIGAWPRLDHSRIEAVRAMQIFGDTMEAESKNNELNLTHGTPLAYIVEHAALMEAMQAEMVVRTNIRQINGASVVGFSDDAAPRTVTLSDGTVLTADLVIAADGSASKMRDLAGISTISKDYESDGVVANFHVARPHLGVARQWFSEQGVLAYLPLPNNNMSIVFSVANAYADTLMALSETDFADEIARVGHASLGALTLASPRARFPLQRVMARHWVQSGFALVGDAAHAIHPLAGQGANLGFSDVTAMSDILANRSSLSAIGDLAVLRRYERARREDAASMGEVTNGLRDLYLSPAGWAKRLRNDGLGLLNRAPMAKSLLVGHVIR
jgi:2-polyprenylphenol 6-hydroxylase